MPLPQKQKHFVFKKHWPFARWWGSVRLVVGLDLIPIGRNLAHHVLKACLLLLVGHLGRGRLLQNHLAARRLLHNYLWTLGALGRGELQHGLARGLHGCHKWGRTCTARLVWFGCLRTHHFHRQHRSLWALHFHRSLRSLWRIQSWRAPHESTPTTKGWGRRKNTSGSLWDRCRRWRRRRHGSTT